MNLSKNDLKPVREGRRRADVRYVARSLAKYAKPYLPLFFLVFFASLAGTVLSLLGPQVCGYAINEIKPGGGTNFTAIGRYAAVLAGVYAASGVLSYLSAIGLSYFSRCIIKRIRADLSSKLMTLPVAYFDARQAGDIISVLSYDLDTLGESLATTS